MATYQSQRSSALTGTEPTYISFLISSWIMYCGNTECPVHANINIFENVALIFPFSKKKKKDYPYKRHFWKYLRPNENGIS